MVDTLATVVVVVATVAAVAIVVAVVVMAAFVVGEFVPAAVATVEFVVSVATVLPVVVDLSTFSVLLQKLLVNYLAFRLQLEEQVVVLEEEVAFLPMVAVEQPPVKEAC